MPLKWIISLFVELHEVRNFLTALLLFILDIHIWSAFLVEKQVKWKREGSVTKVKKLLWSWETCSVNRVKPAEINNQLRPRRVLRYIVQKDL